MQNQLIKTLFILLILSISSSLFSQEGIVSGTLTAEEDGLPLPGVSIIVKGTTRGVQTDFDGNYSIRCSVGETLVFTYVGSVTREIRVSPIMFDVNSKDLFVEKIAVKPIENNAYKNAIKSQTQTEFSLPSIDKSKRTYNRINRYQFNRIKQIDIEKTKVNLTYFKPDVFFEIGLNQSFSSQFFKEQNLPKLQSTFAQGASFNGTLNFLGADTENAFSYGPKLSGLEFDGTNYLYDNNGRLVTLGSGNGKKAVNYDNSVLQSSHRTSNHLYVNVSTDYSLLGMDYTYTSSKDVFNREKNNGSEVALTYKKRVVNDKLSWDAFIKYGSSLDNQPNINGFLNNILLNTWSTPSSFSNTQGFILENNSQRRFNSNFNNPEWLLENNRNYEKTNFFIASVQNILSASDDIKINSIFNYTKNEDKQHFGLVKNSVGFEEGYLSSKEIKKNVFNALASFEYDNYDSHINVASVLDFSSEKLKYSLNEATGFSAFSFNNPENRFNRSIGLNRNTLSIINKFTYNFNDAGIKMVIGNNSYLSSLQKNKWFLPLLQLKLDINDVFDTYIFNDFYVTATTLYNINDAPLFYKNQSHNSLGLLPSQSQSYTSNNDLFLNDSIALEEHINQELSLTANFSVFQTNFNFEFNYFNNTTKGSVFPIFENNAFKLKNSADIRNRGVEIDLSTNFELANRFYYSPSIAFSTNRTKVLYIESDALQIPIAGFSKVSKNLILGQPAGMIVGSAYERDGQNNIIIDPNGFPVVANQPAIIGDPTPDFNLGISNSFSFKDLTLNIVLDIQKGGDVWNGTQNILNYLGVSQQSANQRTITDFIFKGVDQQGNPNTIPVDFYAPENDISQNRFVRYGFSGVDEDAIEDGSYINLKSIDLSYLLKLDKKKPSFVREIKFSVYALNLFTWNRFEGASPYRNLYDAASGQGLNFFNMPIATEIGFKMNIKI